MFAPPGGAVKPVVDDGGEPGGPSPSPPSDRVVSVVELLARAETSLSIRAVSRLLRLNRSTCTAILATLEGRGWVERDHHDRFCAGAALLALGNDLRDRHPVIARAEALLADAAADLRVGGSLTRAEDEWLTTLVLISPDASPPARARRPPLPARLALRPPMGAVIVAFADDPGVVGRWLADAPDPATAEHLARFLSSVRELGIGVFRFDDVATAIAERLAAVKRSTDPRELGAKPSALDEVGLLLLDLGRHGYTSAELTGARGPLPVAMLAAPVFDGAGKASYELAFHVAQPAVPRQALGHLVSRLVSVADELTSVCGGKPSARRPAWP